MHALRSHQAGGVRKPTSADGLDQKWIHGIGASTSTIAAFRGTRNFSAGVVLLSLLLLLLRRSARLRSTTKWLDDFGADSAGKVREINEAVDGGAALAVGTDSCGNRKRSGSSDRCAGLRGAQKSTA